MGNKGDKTMRVQTRNIYKFDELSDDSKENALNELRSSDGYLQYKWYDHVYDDAKIIGGLMGIEIDKIYFSGFSCQGDGACFEGTYSYNKGATLAVKSYAPQDKELHSIVLALQQIQRPMFYGLVVHVKQSGHYNHEYCTQIDIYNESEIGDYYIDSSVHDELADVLRDFMRWIYKQLESEYWYLMSDDAIIEDATANEWEFYENGSWI